MFGKRILISISSIIIAGGTIATVVLLLKKDDNKNEKKDVVSAENLKITNLQITGSNSAQQIKLKTGISLPQQVEVKYYKGTKANPNSEDFDISPTNLTNGDVVKIKFFIKKEYTDTHQFPKTFKNSIFNVQVVNNNLKVLIDTTNLVRNAFILIGVEDYSGKVVLHHNVNLPDQIEVKYYKGNKTSPNDSDYKNNAHNLKNGDVVKIKFFIKTEYTNTHQFPEGFTNSINFEVENLRTTTRLT